MSGSSLPFNTTETWPKDQSHPARLRPAEAIAGWTRLDQAPADLPNHDIQHRRAAAACWILLACGFVLIGGGNLDLGPSASRLGMAAGEGIGPYGQVYGGYDPALWVGRVLPSQLWAWGEGGTPTAAAVRWPEAIALLIVGLLLSRRMSQVISPRAGVLLALVCFGSWAGIHRAGDSRLDLMATMAAAAAIDRILGKKSDLVAGAWTALAFLIGGWPPVALVALPIVIIGRPGQTLSWKLLAPVAAVILAWSAWTLSVAPAQAWAAALTLPLTQPMAWSTAFDTLGIGLPWIPLAALAAWPSVRGSWTPRGRSLIIGWIQVSGVAILAGTLIPGLTGPASGLAWLGLAVATAGVLDAALAGSLTPGARRTFLGATLGIILVASLLALPGAGYLAAAVSYYRQIAWVLILLSLSLCVVGAAAAWKSHTGWAVGALVALAIGLKLFHWGIYVPEWNYRVGKGPWGRAVGQWVLPGRPIYTFHTWPSDLMFHIGRPARQLTAPEALKHRIGAEPAWVLLQEAEFEHWPAKAPAIVKVRQFENEWGTGSRVLARTEGRLAIGPRSSNGHMND